MSRATYSALPLLATSRVARFTYRPASVSTTSFGSAQPMCASGSSHMWDQMTGIGSPSERHSSRVRVNAPFTIRS
jgi:hypothetical protein